MNRDKTALNSAQHYERVSSTASVKAGDVDKIIPDSLNLDRGLCFNRR